MSRDRSNSIHRGEAITLKVDQAQVQAYAGETIATALLAHGITTFNRTSSGQPRGPYCNMGTCFECQVQIATPVNAEFRWVRACMMTARDGMSIITGASLVDRPRTPVQPVRESDESDN